jgi:hypothetical protein
VKKLTLLAVVLALLLAAAVPAIATEDGGEIAPEIGQESESGDVNITPDVSSSGDYASQCVAPLQFGNTGNLQNGQGVLQYFSDADDIEFEGSSFEFSPSVETTCDQAVQQSSAASS